MSLSFLLEAVREWDFLKIPSEPIVDDDSEQLLKKNQSIHI